MRRIAAAATLITLAMLTVAPAKAETRILLSRSHTFKTAVPCSVACSYTFDEASTACTKPGPPGTYADKVVTAPRYSTYLIFRAYPVTDWDIFVCYGTKLMGYSYNSVEESERIFARVVSGRKYTLRAFNFADAEPLPARYVFGYSR